MSVGNIVPSGVYPMRAYYYGRFSDKKQGKGTSHERQLELAQDWCRRKKIPLDETLSYFDKGKSGYHGEHRKQGGGLALFLAGCAAGRVGKGSFLLVESLDRLSREQLPVFQRLVHQLLFDYSIRLVVLFGEMEFNAENYETTHWLLDAEAQRAHSESRTKSIRSKDNWERRRKLNIVTRKVPSWLRVDDGQFVLDEVRAAAVRRIFALACSGHGYTSICRVLTEEKIPPISSDQFWRPSYVEKVLKSRQTIGEYQPRKLENGKRVAAGPVRVGYFPAVVTMDQFTKAQQAMSGRRVPRGRAGGVRVANLFTGLTWEGEQRTAYTSKNKVGYLQRADGATPGVRYDQFERVVLAFLSEVKLSLDNSADVTSLRNRADVLAAKIRTLSDKIKTAPDELAELVDTLATWKRDHAALVQEIEAATVPLQTTFLHCRRLIAHMDGLSGPELADVRREVRLSVGVVISRIDVERAENEVNISVTFKDGTKRGMWYGTKAGRIVAYGATWTGEGVDEEPDGFLENIIDVSPADIARIQCREMREAGKSYKEIQAATGLHRVTICRYLRQ